MTPAVTLRRAGAEDMPALLEVWAAAARAAHPFVPGEGRGARRRLVAEHFLPRAETTLAEAEGRPLGFASVIEDELAGLYVLPEAQGRGIGRRLLAAASAGRGPLVVTVFARNEGARRFYARTGFAETGRGICGETGEILLRLTREEAP